MGRIKKAILFVGFACIAYIGGTLLLRKVARDSFVPQKDSLKGEVAIVAGASRGVGKGIAIALGEAGATVYVLARTSRGDKSERAKTYGGSVEETAEAVDAAGGRGVPMIVDCTSNEQVDAVVKKVVETEGRLDIVVGSVLNMPTESTRTHALDHHIKFWDRLDLWDTLVVSVAKSAYLLASSAVANTVAAGKGSQDNLLVVTIGGPTSTYVWNALYTPHKAFVNYFTRDAYTDLTMAGLEKDVSMLTILPGMVATERIILYSPDVEDRYGI